MINASVIIILLLGLATVWGAEPATEPAQDVEYDVEIKVRPGRGASEFGNIPRPHLIRAGRHELWYSIGRMA